MRVRIELRKVNKNGCDKQTARERHMNDMGATRTRHGSDTGRAGVGPYAPVLGSSAATLAVTLGMPFTSGRSPPTTSAHHRSPPLTAAHHPPHAIRPPCRVHNSRGFRDTPYV
ncbi:unnamed protein product, partial [Iphiclides podalirius]